MIPLRDIIPSRTTPVVTISIIALNVLVFIYELSLGRAVDAFTLYYGLVPAAFSWTNVFTSMFLHGSFLHVAGNMTSTARSAVAGKVNSGGPTVNERDIARKMNEGANRRLPPPGYARCNGQ